MIPDDITDIAAQFGITFDDEQAAQLADEAEAFRDRLDVFEPADPVDDAVEAYEPGNDDYNAFRYKFDLTTGDGPLSDLDIGVKDNIAVSGVPMHCGSRVMDFTPSYHATAISNLLDDGATVVGTTNMDKLAYFTTGETCDFGNVVHPDHEGRVPGGSSAGSGTTVAAGLADAALGTDTGGSVRIPASFCGVVGFKPTYRSVSRFGFVDLAPSLDHIGTLAKSVETAARVVESMTSMDLADPSTYATKPPRDITARIGNDIADLDVALIEEAFDGSDTGVSRAGRDTAEALADQGCTVDSVSVPEYSDIVYALTTIESCEFASLLLNNGHVYGPGTGYSEGWRQALSEFMTTGEYGEHLEESLVINTHLLAVTQGRQYVAAQNARRDFIRSIGELFERYDALITPTTPMTAPEFGEISTLEDLFATEANTGPFNLTGHPAVSVPSGQVEGLPVGLQVVADWNDDAVAIQVAAAIE